MVWPGKGPFRNLPPWERPGWIYGRCCCLILASSSKEVLEKEKEILKQRLEEVEERLKR